MNSFFLRVRKFLLDVDQKELRKVIYLTLAYFFIIAAYTVCKELKEAVFTSVVGADRKYQAYAKFISMLVLIPAIFLHSRLVDKLRRHQLLYIYGIFFGSVGIFFAYLMGHPTIGLANTITSPHRLFGWLFYFFIEGYAPLLLSVYWAFANSVTTPEAVKNNYTTMITGSKLGGILTATTAWFICRSGWSDTTNLQVILTMGSLFALCVPIAIYLLVRRVPGRELHGYEAAYKVEKERSKGEAQESSLSSMTSGLVMLLKYPYVMGIFGMSFFFELVNQALKVENILFGKQMSDSLSQFTGFLLWQSLLVHMVGLVMVFFGTRALLEALGERKSLMLVPMVTGLSIIGFIVRPSYFTAVIAFVVTRSVNYAFSVPLRESLYIPTIKEIKFKTKSWVDGFGTKFAKMSSMSFNYYADGLAASMLVSAQAGFFMVTVVFWFITAYALGRRFEKAVQANEVIGSTEIV